MLATTATTKGQIVIPAVLRRQFNIQPGTRLAISADARGERIIVQPITREYLHALRGKYQDKGLLTALRAERKRDARRER